MKQHVMLTVTSLLSIILFSIHLAGDIVRGIEPGTATNLTAIPILVVWLCGALVLAERRSGHIIMLLGALLATAVPILHLRGTGVGGAFAKSSGAFLFIWTLFALGVTGTFAAILSVREMRSARQARVATSPR
jgi:hypothetical protein